ncbi:MAG: hypothetical protein RL380_295 [Verrucomicrobiota bacterium]
MRGTVCSKAITMNTALEVKFACPVCHQHIRCDAASSGQIMSCPTCFRNIVVPQAPSGQTTRLILRAKQAPARRERVPVREPLTVRKTFGWATAASAVLVAMTLFVVNQVKHFKLAHRQPVATENTGSNEN